MKKDVPGYEGLYAATKEGKLWSYRKNRFLSPYIGDPGYPLTPLKARDGTKRLTRIHRIIAATFLPNPNNLPQVNHKNGIKTDNRVDNLEWVTSLENVSHSWRLGLKKAHPGLKGSKNPKSKVTDVQVLEMRKLRKQGVFLKDISKQFGISLPGVWDIVTHRHWKHIP